jgi:hypothetical protein
METKEKIENVSSVIYCSKEEHKTNTDSRTDTTTKLEGQTERYNTFHVLRSKMKFCGK